jgi:hypothetical protein
MPTFARNTLPSGSKSEQKIIVREQAREKFSVPITYGTVYVRKQNSRKTAYKHWLPPEKMLHVSHREALNVSGIVTSDQCKQGRGGHQCTDDLMKLLKCSR